MELLRKYWLPLTVALVIAALILVFVIVGIKNSGRDLPSWKGIDTAPVSSYSGGTVAQSAPAESPADSGTEANMP